MLIEIHARSTGISDPALFSLSNNVGYAPHTDTVKFYTFGDIRLFQEPILENIRNFGDPDVAVSDMVPDPIGSPSRSPTHTPKGGRAPLFS